jgi:hypothetical protein
MKNIANSVLMVSASLMIYNLLTFSAFAGGGNETIQTTVTVPPNQVQTGNGILQSQNQPGGVIGNTAVSSPVPLSPLQSGNYNYSTTSTQFSGGAYGGVQCGFSVGVGATNSNTALQQVYTADVRYNSAPCPDYRYQAQQESRRVQMSVQGSAINTCIIARRDLAVQGKNPDDTCPAIKQNQFNLISD